MERYRIIDGRKIPNIIVYIEAKSPIEAVRKYIKKNGESGTVKRDNSWKGNILLMKESSYVNDFSYCVE